jgi:protoporphyrinogen IX oxidase
LAQATIGRTVPAATFETIPMDYQTLLALHLVAIVVWIGGMLVNGAILGGTPQRRTIETARRWNLRLVSPAMLLVWAIGITLAVEGGWFAAHWLSTKLIFVLALSALHGMQSGTLRRMVKDPARKPSGLVRASAPLTIVAVLIVGCLAVMKPF